MTKEELVDRANNLYEEAFTANQYWLIVKQLSDAQGKYQEEMNLAPVFMWYSSSALMDALIMRLAKLYETGDAIGLRSLLQAWHENISLFPENRGIDETTIDGRVYRDILPFKVKIRREDKALYNDAAAEHQNRVKMLQDLFPEENFDMVDETFELEVSREKLQKHYLMRISKLNEVIDNLRNQRNKIYAHYNAETNFDFESVYKAYPIRMKDLEELVQLAMDICGTCVELLTGVCKAREYSNMGVDPLFRMAQIGLLYQDQYINDLCNKKE